MDNNQEQLVQFIEKHESPSIVGRFSGTGWIDLQTFKPLTLFIDKNGIAREYVFGRKLEMASFKRCHL